MESSKPKKISSLKNHFLLAMPGLTDPNFADSVIYICEHNADGAMGLIINHQLDVPVKAIFEQLDVEYQDEFARSLLFDGGPVQRERGFILHPSCDQQWESTMSISDQVSLTASKDILSDIALGVGPKDALITLGYTGWDAGQLEEELTENSWLTIPAEADIIFNTSCAERASAAAFSIGLDLRMLSHEAGHA
ncbi:MAG: YqgE/AlgH family protein [Porticoccaceae bacterium]|nr:YqgE/AlgH family protein [Porticoccaceae bacterium]